MKNYIPGREYTREDFGFIVGVVQDGRGILCGMYLKDAHDVVNWTQFMPITENIEYRRQRLEEHFQSLTVEQFKDFLGLQPPRKGKKAKK